jgi:nickel/cobalt exporter
MTELSTLLQQGTAASWLFIPSAVALGALHGLEPGHSKTMMAAFIIAVRGTVKQAVLLGLAATVSHTAVVWAVALGGLYLGHNLNSETSEPYFQMGSAVMMIAIALWMLIRTYKSHHQAHHTHAHPHTHFDKEMQELGVLDDEVQDAHERKHAEDIRRRFTGGPVTTGQILMFGLTGGLIPCPAAITVLLLCLQLKRMTLGIALVLCFSVGLALTMVGAGTVAALSAHHIGKRWDGFGAFARKAPYASGIVIICVALYLFAQGWLALP